MLEMELALARKSRLSVLCLGAHCDDIEIGCGGTLLALRAQRTIDVTWVVFSANEARAAETRAAARDFLGDGDPARVRFHGFRDGFLPYEGAAVKDAFEQLKAGAKPDLIFTHARVDAHQDHRLVNELTWNTFRDHLILEYEIPKWDGDLGRPDTYVPLDEATARLKARLLREHFASQAGRRWFEEELFLALLRIRGMECNAASGFAEAFWSRKLRLLP